MTKEEKNNEHIFSYCKEFIESKESPHFAILLKGGWGVGKTYFIEKLIGFGKKKNTKRGLLVDIEESEVVKISLFGVSSVDEIDTKIFQAVHPLLASKAGQIAGCVLKSALKLGVQVDVNGDGKKDMSVSLSNFFSNEKGEKTKLKKRLLIIDDLERAEIPISRIFGYFSQIITESDMRVIFVGNEEKITPIKNTQEDKRESKDENEQSLEAKDYSSIKEKTIGMELLLCPEKENAVESFLQEITFEKGEKIFIKEKIIEVSDNLECDNLRVIRQCLYNLKRLLKVLPTDISIRDKEVVIGYFILLFIQKSLNMIKEGDQPYEIISVYNRRRISYLKYKEEQGKAKTKNENDSRRIYYMGYRKDNLFKNEIWSEIVFNGKYDIDSLAKEYKDLQDARKTTQLYKLIKDWQDCSKEDFKNLVIQVEEDFVKGQYLHPGQILHYIGLFLFFSQKKLIPNSIEMIKEQVNEVLEKYKDDFTTVQFGNLGKAYSGYQYYSIDMPEFKEFVEKIETNNTELLKGSAKKNFCRDVDNLSKGSISDFITNIIPVSSGNRYSTNPVISYINVQDFYNKLKNFSIQDRHEIIDAFEERYGMRNDDSKLPEWYKPDYENLLNLYKLCESKESKDIEYNPSVIQEKEITQRFLKIVNYFETQMGKEKTTSPNA